MHEGRAIEVAIIGGGCASLTTAFELTRPEHRGRYRVTIYQLGWRLGGKGASGRGRDGRIEEHGLHLWLGYYENAFRMLRQCYAELGRDPASVRFADWDEAFEPAPCVALADRSTDGRWLPWIASFPTTSGLPGDPLEEENPFTIRGYLVRTAALLGTLLESIRVRGGEPPLAESDSRSDKAATPEGIRATISRLLRFGQLATLGAVAEAMTVLEAALRALPGSERLLLHLLEALAVSARSQVETLVADDDESRRLWEIADLALAFLRGALRFGLLTDPRGLDCIDDYDCREWLRLNGASDMALESAFVRALYDLAFSYEGGDPEKPRMAAGQGIRGALRMFFTYRGALFWRMKAGMGDVVFAPLYEVLKRRGVRFEFFHRLENVRLADSAAIEPGEKPYVEALEFDVQAEVVDGEYRPLVDVAGLPCWPAQPDWSQLADGDRLEHEGWDFESFWDRRKVGQKVLRVVEDFDFVVLGVSVGAIPHVCGEILARDARWRTMVDQVRTVATQAFQLWLKVDMKELGWDGPQMNLSGFVEPFDTWADMRHIIPCEEGPDVTQAIAYFCNVLQTPEGVANSTAKEYPARMHEQVRRNAVEFLNNEIDHLWPHATHTPGQFRWEELVEGSANEDKEGVGEQRFQSQFWTANVNPSDRYVLSLPGTLQHRISPLDNTYDNLTIAGDWTHCGHNHGCVEAAVMSGRLAAHALSHLPPLEEIIGYDHP